MRISDWSSDVCSSDLVQRYVDILIHCHTRRSRSYILEKLIKLDDTHNTFKRVAGKLVDYGWLDYTVKESKNSLTEAYYNTDDGHKMLRLAGDKDCSCYFTPHYLDLNYLNSQSYYQSCHKFSRKELTTIL